MFILVLIFSSCKESNELVNETDDFTSNEANVATDFDFLPTSITNAIYHRSAYVFSYSEAHEQSEWVAYYLDVDDINSTHFDRPFFTQDPLVKSNSADWRNYKNSDYDKGHLCPAGDRKESYKSFQETFFLRQILVHKNMNLI